MSKRNLLPVANFNAKEKGGVSPLAFDRWNPAIKASDENDNTIGILIRLVMTTGMILV